MKILGLLGGVSPLMHHDAGAALLVDGKIVAAAEEERFVRIKSGLGCLPIKSISACLKEAGLSIKDIDLVAHCGNTFDDLEGRIDLYLRHYFGHAPKIALYNHQRCHLAQAYYASPFAEAMILSYDGHGDSLSGALGIGRGNKIEVLEERGMGSSLGLFYSTMTSYLGFETLDSEYKVMGLAPYGKPTVDLSPFLSVDRTDYTIDFSFIRGKERERTLLGAGGAEPPVVSRFEPWYTNKLVELLGRPARRDDEPFDQFYRDVAHATQRQFEKAVVSLVTRLHEKTGLRKLAIGGGCALNCTANYVISKLPFIDEIYVPPAVSDRGISLGAALVAAAEHGEVPRGMSHAYLGPTYRRDQIEEALKLSNISYEEIQSPAADAAERLARGEIIGWFQGRSEYGPRALGARSILADPRRAEMKDEINRRVKFREEFRPFAPAVKESSAGKIFKLLAASPFMTMAVEVQPAWRDKIPAVTHIDGTARVQTVNAHTAPDFHDLLDEFEKLTGVPVLLNTSFNIKGEPIVETPLNAIATFAASGIDTLYVGPFRIVKSKH